MEIVYYVAASLDGFIATPDGGIEWLKPFEVRGSTACFSAAGPTSRACGSPNGPTRASRAGSSRGGSPARAVKYVAAEGVRRAWLVGGGKLAAAFRADGLITEYIV